MVEETAIRVQINAAKLAGQGIFGILQAVANKTSTIFSVTMKVYRILLFISILKIKVSALLLPCYMFHIRINRAFVKSQCIKLI